VAGERLLRLYLKDSVKAVKLTSYLLKRPEVSGHYLLSERFSQDPVENYFGQQRAAGAWL
jgi:hypothetical protein